MSNSEPRGWLQGVKAGVKRGVPKMRSWEIVVMGVGGLFSLGIGVADLFSVQHVWGLVRSILLIVGGVVILATLPVAWRQRVDGRAKP
jgi:hypothetical protein